MSSAGIPNGGSGACRLLTATMAPKLSSEKCRCWPGDWLSYLQRFLGRPSIDSADLWIAQSPEAVISRDKTALPCRSGCDKRAAGQEIRRECAVRWGKRWKAKTNFILDLKRTSLDLSLCASKYDVLLVGLKLPWGCLTPWGRSKTKTPTLPWSIVRPNR